MLARKLFKESHASEDVFLSFTSAPGRVKLPLQTQSGGHVGSLMSLFHTLFQ